jgi:hypothetical protein
MALVDRGGGSQLISNTTKASLKTLQNSCFYEGLRWREGDSGKLGVLNGGQTPDQILAQMVLYAQGHPNIAEISELHYRKGIFESIHFLPFAFEAPGNLQITLPVVIDKLVCFLVSIGPRN